MRSRKRLLLGEEQTRMVPPSVNVRPGIRRCVRPAMAPDTEDEKQVDAGERSSTKTPTRQSRRPTAIMTRALLSHLRCALPRQGTKGSPPNRYGKRKIRTR